ncbi:sugar ABC transporter substrate-binding protein [Neobacillus piezotolerans]|uniref:Sugar ABC transporter substrate-binding protein n=1 Tax=Neobacillus piezotolerans TaxID=2259171 RepID=A0A3D8GNF6_9BACI|nr:substrate-binding domain-containing protein [Neobacillus piezotolerans]RDU36025.1 sugar ABC transporter substrate-binding protein [Neobacillus piezotolerans]
MRKTGMIALCIAGIILSYFTFLSAEKAFRSDLKLPQASVPKKEQYRLVLITKELETPFWDKVGIGALQQAEKEGTSIEIWGSYGNNEEEFLKKVEIAIQSKVDGIIVQGLDTKEFKDLTKVKAAFYGIPVITVANDVPKSESLRRTYVGSDQLLAGKMIAEQLIADMGATGDVALMYDSHHEYYQEQRLNGIREVLKEYPNIQTITVDTANTREQIIAATQEVLNEYPNVDGFIAVNATIVGPMIQEIGRRSQVAPYYLYSFDDGPESLSLLMQGKLDAMIEQSPVDMGKTSVELLIKWLDGDAVPLDMDGYLTDIKVLKAIDMR